jgi:hypothetical protein
MYTPLLRSLAVLYLTFLVSISYRNLPHSECINWVSAGYTLKPTFDGWQTLSYRTN